MSFFPPPPIPFCGKKFYVTEELSFPLVFSYLGHVKLEWPQLEVWRPWSPCVTAPPPHMEQETFGTSCITRIDNGFWCGPFPAEEGCPKRNGG